VEALRGMVFQNAAQRFIQGTKEYLLREDPAFCLQRDLVDFVLTAERVGERIKVTHTQ
jgi:hypothetical protein